MEMRSTANNSTLAIGGVSSPLDSFVVTESSVLRTTFSAENPTARIVTVFSQSGVTSNF
nr:hypothetical protein [uncultured Flavobacterium sp.]